MLSVKPITEHAGVSGSYDLLLLGDMEGDKIMTKNEAIEFMKKHPGEHVFHWMFDPSEYLYMKADGKIYTEEGYLFEDFHTNGRYDGMRMRTGSGWETGWGYESGFVNHTKGAVHNG